MSQGRHSADQIVAKLRKANVELGHGKKLAEQPSDMEIANMTDFDGVVRPLRPGLGCRRVRIRGRPGIARPASGDNRPARNRTAR